MLAVQVGIDVLHDVDVLPVQASEATFANQNCTVTDLLSRINLISFTKVFMFVDGEIYKTAQIFKF